MTAIFDVMNNVITKELLSEVLVEEYSDRLVERIEINDNLLQTFYMCSSKGISTCLGIEINIHELAYKCKEWASTKGYFLSSDSEGYCLIATRDEEDETIIHITNEWFAKTEPEAIFKACQWILKDSK